MHGPLREPREDASAERKKHGRREARHRRQGLGGDRLLALLEAVQLGADRPEAFQRVRDAHGQLGELFRASYEAVFATSFLDNEIEIVNWKIEARGPRPELAKGYRPPHPPRAEDGVLAQARCWFPRDEAYVDCPVLDRYALASGAVVEGPALIQEDESTSVLGPGERVTIDAFGNLIAELAAD